MMYLKKYVRGLLLSFAFISAMLVIFTKKLTSAGIATEVVIIGNIIVFIVTLLSLILLIRGLKAKATSSFIQSVYGSIMVKMFICAIAVFIYIKTSTTVNKPAIFILMGLYLLYTFIEMAALRQVTKDIKANAQGKSTI